MNFSTIARESTALNLASLVERHCPRLMRCGGGAISREDKAPTDGNHGARIGPEMRDRILALGREGKLSPTAIARQLNTTQSTVRSLFVREGVPIVNGRFRARRSAE